MKNCSNVPALLGAAIMAASPAVEAQPLSPSLPNTAGQVDGVLSNTAEYMSQPAAPTLAGGQTRVEAGELLDLQLDCEDGGLVHLFVDGQFVGAEICENGEVSLRLIGQPLGIHHVTYRMVEQDQEGLESLPLALEVVTYSGTNTEFQPDIQMGQFGADVYGRQRKKVKTTESKITYPPVFIGNDGDTEDDLILCGNKGHRGMKVKYFSPEGQNITGGVVRGTYERPVDAGEKFKVRVKAALTGAGERARKVGHHNKMHVYSTGAPGRQDSLYVRSVVKPPKR